MLVAWGVVSTHPFCLEPPITGLALYHAQQAAEKALKAVLVSLDIEFPRTHNIRTLLDLLPGEIPTPSKILEAASLTDYAVLSRYPGYQEPIEQAEYQKAMSLAESVVT